MQRIRDDRRRIIFFYSLFVFFSLILIWLDQFTKNFFEKQYLEHGVKCVIDNFFYFTYTVNTGSAFSFLADKSWGQLFFKILTPIALIVFIIFLVYSQKNNYKILSIGIVLMISGTIGNYIDRLLYNGVSDFISLKFWTYNFPIFNLADVFLTLGVIMLFIHLLFLDKNAVFIKNESK